MRSAVSLVIVIFATTLCWASSETLAAPPATNALEIYRAAVAIHVIVDRDFRSAASYARLKAPAAELERHAHLLLTTTKEPCDTAALRRSLSAVIDQQQILLQRLRPLSPGASGSASSGKIVLASASNSIPVRAATTLSTPGTPCPMAIDRLHRAILSLQRPTELVNAQCDALESAAGTAENAICDYAAR